jgi:uncharacterized protein
MKIAKIAGDAGADTRVVILESGEEAISALTKAANDVGITAASLTAIGAFESATVGWFDFEKKTYKKIEIAQQCPTARRAAAICSRARFGPRWRSFLPTPRPN